MTNTLHIYTRVSTRVQDTDGTSLDTQEKIGVKKSKFQAIFGNFGTFKTDRHCDILGRRPQVSQNYNNSKSLKIVHLDIFVVRVV